MENRNYIFKPSEKVEMLESAIKTVELNHSICYSLGLKIRERLNKQWIFPETQDEFDMHKFKPDEIKQGWFWWPIAKDAPNQWIDVRLATLHKMIDYWQNKP